MWFNGPITKAVEKTRAEKTMLIVFVFGHDEKSASMQKNLENETIQEICRKHNCVALKLEDKSEAAKQFTEFYPLSSIPTVYFIGSNGKSLEVVTDLINVDQLHETFSKALQVYEPIKSFGQVPTTSTNQTFTGATDTTQRLLDERVALAQEKIKQKQEERAKQEEEDQKAKEIKRREEGKMVNKAREQQKEQEILAAAAERKRDKENDKAHLLKLREQIAADRAEKSQTYQAKKSEELQETQRKKEQLEKQNQDDAEAARLAHLERCKYARIQFRLPDGSTMAETFDAEVPFFEAKRFAESRVPNLVPFQLIQMFPRREFSAQEFAKSFKELQLVPSIVLMILPESRRGGGGGGGNSQGWLQRVISLITMPFFSLFAWLQLLVFGQQARGGARQSVTGSTPGVSNPRNFGTQEGNIRRMPGNNDTPKNADDDNATWNGNSTQQL